MSVGCFSCGATQTPVTEHDIPAQRVWLCADCTDLFRTAGLLVEPPSDFAHKFRAAIDSPAPGSSPPTG